MRKIVRRPPRPGATAVPPDLPEQDDDLQDDEAPDDDLPEVAADDPPPDEADQPVADARQASGQKANDGAGPDGAAAGWATAELILPRSKKLVSLRIDADVLDYFQRGGKGYQTRMNAVLRAFMDARNRR